MRCIVFAQVDSFRGQVLEAQFFLQGFGCGVEIKTAALDVIHALVEEGGDGRPDCLFHQALAAEMAGNGEGQGPALAAFQPPHHLVKPRHLRHPQAADDPACGFQFQCVAPLRPVFEPQKCQPCIRPGRDSVTAHHPGHFIIHGVVAEIVKIFLPELSQDQPFSLQKHQATSNLPFFRGGRLNQTRRPKMAKLTRLIFHPMANAAFL